MALKTVQRLLNRLPDPGRAVRPRRPRHRAAAAAVPVPLLLGLCARRDPRFGPGWLFSPVASFSTGIKFRPGYNMTS